MGSPPIRFTKEPRMTVGYVEVKGPYSGVGAAMAELDEWVASKGAERDGHPFCMFFDNPFETPEEKLRSAACIPVRGRPEPEGRIMLKELPEVDAAETRHAGRPEDFGKTYGPFLEALVKEGWSIAEPAREYFQDAANVNGPGAGYLIRQPVHRK